MRSRRLAVVVGIGCACLLGACGESGSAGDAEVKVGHLLSLTGPNAPFGPASEKAGKLAIQEVQKALKKVGADDVSVTIVTEDEQTTEQGAVQAARKALSEGANILAGVWSSGGTLAAANAVAIRQGVGLITPVSTATTVTELDDDGLVSRIIPADDIQAISVAQVAEEEVGADATLSLAGVNAAYGAGFAEDFKQIWEAGGGTTTGPVLYDPTQADFDSEATDIVAGNPDGYVFFDYPDSFAKLTRSLLRTGSYDGGRAFFTEAIGALDALEGTGIQVEALQGATGTQPTSPAGTATARAFDELYKTSDLEPAERYTYDTNTFDTVMLAALAGVAARSSDSREIADQVRAVSSPPGKQYTFQELPAAVRALLDGQDINFEGISGPLDQDENGDLVEEAATFKAVTFNADGRKKTIKQFMLRAGE